MSDTTEQNPLIKPETPRIDEPSIVDTILNLDELLSADVRRAEKTARFSTKPWLEGEIEELEVHLDQLTDGRGNPLRSGETSLAEASNPAYAVAQKIEEMRRELADSFVSVRVQQLPADQWMAFEQKHREALDKGAPYPNEMWDELIVKCAIAPKMTLDQVRSLRSKLGHPPMHEIALKCWNVCTNAGVSVPKSPLSSHVLRQQPRETS